jgi:hypothetical protein
MPSERSLYRKIQLALDVAKSVTIDSLKELATEIESGELPSFNTLQYDRERDEFIPRQSTTSIRRVLRLCLRLNLLDDDGRLTANGRSALRKAKFDSVLSSQVVRDLEQNGVNLGKINALIRSKLKADPPILPTAAELWESIQPELTPSDFSGLLTLLVNCGAAESSQRRIFLRIS